MQINEEQINKILSKLSEGLSKENLMNTGKNGFNIFNVLGVETKEVIICRFLGELLKPYGSHGLGTLPLEAFLKDVIKIDSSYTKAELENAEIVLEDVIDNNRRVDIVIYIAEKVYPIEVKVWAGDQDAQLQDYYRYYFGNSDNDKIYYLTPTGWEPSSDSRGDLEEQIVRLSFDKYIRKWLDCILTHMKEKVISQPAVQIIVSQFKEVINIMCEKTKELRNIQNALGLNNDFDKIENIGALIALLTNSEELLKSIRIKYIREKLEIDNQKYSLVDAEEDKKVDTHALLKIILKETEKTVAWICVDKNLYLVAKKVMSKELWDRRSVENFYWQYIGPKGIEKPFNLKEMTKLKNRDCSEDCIDIDRLLKDIITDD